MAESPWSGFHRLSAAERLARVARHANLSEEDQAALVAPSGLDLAAADSFVENAVGTFPLPLAFAVHFVIDGEAVVVPMAVEESSVVAAASHGAKLAAQGGGFTTQADDPIMIGQVEVRGVADPEAAMVLAKEREAAWVDAANDLIPSMVQRGGGVRAAQTRIVGRPEEGRLVIHLLMDCRDAMGANLVNTVCEGMADLLAGDLGGTPGLRILSNLATERLASAACRIPVQAVGGAEAAAAIVAANDFALADPWRAATHNKGILNGIDPVVIATGNDWRAVEAGAHAYAARAGTYAALTEWQLDGDHLVGRLELPLALGTVGGLTRLHPVAAACLNVLGAPNATRLARIACAVGLAQNLSALKALAGEGIQRGHMALHARNVALAAGATGNDVSRVANAMVAAGTITRAAAQEFLADE